MATITLTTLISRVRTKGNFKTTDTRLTDAVLTGIINEALEQSALDRDWPWLLKKETITTVSGTSEVAVPADYLRTFSISDSVSGYPLPTRSVIEMDQSIGSGRPTAYNEYGGFLLLKPIPNGVYTFTHRYVRTEVTLATGADTPLIPLAMSAGVVDWAVKLASEEIKATEAALVAERRYVAWLKRADDNLKRTKEPVRVRVRPGSLF